MNIEKNIVLCVFL